MNRKQVLKDMKKKKKEKNFEEETNYVSRFILYLLIFLILLIIGYLIIGIFVNKTISFNKKGTKETSKVTIDNNTILAGEIFDQKEDEYYVLVYNKNEENSILGTWKGVYSGKENALKIYEVDSETKLNGNFIVKENSNKDAQSYSELRIVSPTLIKINNKKIVEYIEGEEQIKNIFKN